MASNLSVNFFVQENITQLNTLEIGTPLPLWSLDAIFGDEVPSIRSYQGKPLLIMFFSLGCPGCIGRSIPYANRVVFEKGDQMSVIGIHTDFHQTGFETAQFIKAKDDFFMRYPFYQDQNYDKTFKDYGAGGTPHWILLDAHGVVQYSLFGSDPNNALLKLDYKIEEVLFENK